jgi:hypothetical protein
VAEYDPAIIVFAASTLPPWEWDYQEVVSDIPKRNKLKAEEKPQNPHQTFDNDWFTHVRRFPFAHESTFGDWRTGHFILR